MIMMHYRSPRSSPQLTGLGRLLAPNRQQYKLGNLVTPTRISREPDLATRARIRNGPLGQHFPAAIQALTAAGFGLADPPSRCPPEHAIHLTAADRHR